MKTEVHVNVNGRAVKTICLTGFSTSSSSTTLYRGRAPRLTSDNFTFCHSETDIGETITSVAVKSKKARFNKYTNFSHRFPQSSCVSITFSINSAAHFVTHFEKFVKDCRSNLKVKIRERNMKKERVER